MIMSMSTGTSQVYERIKLLGTLRVLMVRKIWEAFWSDNGNELDVLLQIAVDCLDGVKLVGQSLGIDIDREKVFPYLPDRDKPVQFIVDICVMDDTLGQVIADSYGPTGFFTYQVAQQLMITKVLSSFRYVDLRSTPKERRALIREQRDLAHAGLTVVGEFLQENVESIRMLLGASFAQKCMKLAEFLHSSTSEQTLARFAAADVLAESPINSLIPNYHEIQLCLDRGRTLGRKLENCAAGQEYWRKYEDLCMDILRFLFVPPFRNVLVQVRSADRHERRDAILPNNQYSGFWQIIREEFNSRHIVCEFKNLRGVGSKASVNQLRIYLSKPTIGRFGLLFVRKLPGKGLLQAQRDAYEQSNILILILDDGKVQKLLKARAYLGSADELLETEKVSFEITY